VSIPFTLKIPETLLNSSTLSTVKPSELVFDVENNDIKLHMVLQSLTVKNPKYTPPSDQNDETPYYPDTAGIALIKNKK
jgi:hypothetical protein